MRDDAAPRSDQLIERIRARAADPGKRTEVQPSVFEAGIQSMSLGGLLSFGGGIADASPRPRTRRAGRRKDASHGSRPDPGRGDAPDQ